MNMSSAQRGFINLHHDTRFTCMAVHPVYPLLAVCDSDNTLFLYHINAHQPPLMRLMCLIDFLAYDCIAFHSTLPFVAAGCRETGQVNFWNIQNMLYHPDEELNFEEPKLKSFATATMVRGSLSYIIFHPTNPYIAVGGVDYDRESVSSFIKIFEVNESVAESVEAKFIELPMDEDDPYDKIESITFSPDGVFLAATFGKHIMVWFYEEMKLLKDEDMHMDVKSLGFSPVDHILVAGCESRSESRIISFKIEKDIPSATSDGWKMTRFTKNRLTSAISTLAFHPLTPLMVCGFVNGDVKSYTVSESDPDDPLSDLEYPFNGPRFPMPSVAFNRQFIVTCGSNIVYVYAIGGEPSFPTEDMPRLFTKIMQFEEQKNIIMEAVRKVFVFEKFSIDESGDYLKVRCEITDKMTRQNCLVLEFIEHNFYKDHYGDGGDMEFELKHEGLVVVYIGGLNKCGANSGNSLLALVDELAKLIPFIEYIALFDASYIMKCDKTVNLFQLKSLASETGDSWYGSKGYKTQSHAEVMTHNKQLRNRNIAELLEVVDPSVKTYIMEAFPELNQHMGMTVHDCFEMMSVQIRSFPEKKCTEDQKKKIEALTKLMSAMEKSSDFKLKEHKDLLKLVSRGGYKRGGTKKRITKKRGGTKKRATKKRATKKRATKNHLNHCRGTHGAKHGAP